MKKAASTSMIYFIAYVLLILPHMNPPYLGRIPSVDVFIRVARLASFHVIFIRFLILRHRISKVAFLIFCVQVYILCVTFLRQGDVYGTLVDSFSVFSIAFLYDSVDDNPKPFLSALLFCFEIVIYVNLITILLYPDGMYLTDMLFHSNKTYFLGFYNNHSQYYIPAFVTAWLYMELGGSRIRVLSLTLAIVTASLLVWSGGILMSIFLMIGVYVCQNLDGFVSLSYYSCWLIHPIFFFAIILLKLQNFFQWLIDGVLHKWSSLVSRMEIWDLTIRFISAHPLIGYGKVATINRQWQYVIHFSMHAHNMLLEILYQGGLAYLLLFTALVLSAGKEILPYRNTKAAQILTIGFLGWCVHTTVEPFMTSFLMGMFVLTCKCGLFESTLESRRKPKTEKASNLHRMSKFNK